MRQRILVVDDDTDIRRIIQLILEAEGFSVILATNGQEALDFVEQGRPQLLLLDLNMPVMDGWTCHTRLLERGHGIPVVIMTAGTNAQTQAQERGAAGYLNKPFELDELLDIVNRLVGTPGTMQCA